MNLLKSALAMGALSMFVVASAEDHMLGEFKFNGFIDGYYQFDFGRPGSGNTLSGRGNDTANNQFTLATAELDITRAATSKIPFGLTINLNVGRNTDLANLNEPGGHTRYKLVRQAFVTYTVPGNAGLTVDFGKFDTWIGYEGIDSRSQDQYSRSFNWTFSEPTYATGLRISGKLNSKASGSLYGVRGWNEVADDNHENSFGAQLNYALSPKFGLTLNEYYGTEGSKTTANDIGLFGGIGFGAPGTAKVNLFDAILTYQWDAKTRVAFNADYASSVGSSNGGHWNGEVIYIRRTLSDKAGWGLRFDRFEDTDGIRTGAPVKFHSLTGTYDYNFTPNFVLRGELRHDISSLAAFPSDNGLKKDRTTFTVGAVLKF